MKKSEKDAIIQKAKGLAFKLYGGYYIFDLPFGNETRLLFDLENHILIVKCFVSYIPIRKIESPEDLENLFNAICPEKYRLPFI